MKSPFFDQKSRLKLISPLCDEKIEAQRVP